MAGYWWECETCDSKHDFDQVAGVRSMSSFVWDGLVPSNWDQGLLTSACPECHEGVLRITYDFPRQVDRLFMRVLHIVGLKFDDYVPMMWETYIKESKPREECIDFKYQRNRNPWGLNKAAHLSRSNLHELFSVYRERTGEQSFP
jgi:hypothetical protein